MRELDQASIRSDFGHESISVRGLQVFIVSIPFLHALGFSQWLPLPMAVAMFAMLLAFLTGGVAWVWVERQDISLALMLILGCLAFIFHTKYVGQKNFNHSAALLVTVVVFYFWMRAWLWRANPSFESLGAAATLALVIASTAVLSEFWLANAKGIYLADFVPYTSKELPFPTVLEDLRRPRGLASEPGFSAMVYEALLPLSLYYLRLRKKLGYFCAPLFAAGFLALFSAGAISAMLIALLTVYLLRGRIPLRLLLIGLFAATALVFTIGAGTLVWVVDEIVGRKILDLFVKGSVNLGEAAGRYDAYRSALSMFVTYPFGIGWGMVSQMYATDTVLPGLLPIASRGTLSLYLEILASAGFLGFAAYCWFHFHKLIAVIQWRNSCKPYVLFGFLSISLHHAFVLEFWFPMLWFYFAIASCILRHQRIEDARRLRPH